MLCPWLDRDRPSIEYVDFLKEENWERLGSKNCVETVIMQQLYQKYFRVPLGWIEKFCCYPFWSPVRQTNEYEYDDVCFCCVHFSKSIGRSISVGPQEHRRHQSGGLQGRSVATRGGLPDGGWSNAVDRIPPYYSDICKRRRWEETPVPGIEGMAKSTLLKVFWGQNVPLVWEFLCFTLRLYEWAETLPPFSWEQRMLNDLLEPWSCCFSENFI